MRASNNVVAGVFFGAEIEPGSFHHFIPRVPAGNSSQNEPDRVKRCDTVDADGSRNFPRNAARTGKDATGAAAPESDRQEASREP